MPHLLYRFYKTEIIYILPICEATTLTYRVTDIYLTSKGKIHTPHIHLTEYRNRVEVVRASAFRSVFDVTSGQPLPPLLLPSLLLPKISTLKADNAFTTDIANIHEQRLSQTIRLTACYYSTYSICRRSVYIYTGIVGFL